jgi:hypothetical protein
MRVVTVLQHLVALTYIAVSESTTVTLMQQEDEKLQQCSGLGLRRSPKDL